MAELSWSFISRAWELPFLQCIPLWGSSGCWNIFTYLELKSSPYVSLIPVSAYPRSLLWQLLASQCSGSVLYSIHGWGVSSPSSRNKGTTWYQLSPCDKHWSKIKAGQPSSSLITVTPKVLESSLPHSWKDCVKKYPATGGSSDLVESSFTEKNDRKPVKTIETVLILS